MSRPSKIVLISAGSVILLLLVILVAGVFIARSDWLREKVRERVIAEVENATGGRVEIGAFRFDWHTLTAELDQFVIHGTEPPSVPPLLRTQKLIVGLKIISLWKRDIDIARLEADSPQTYLIVHPDGTTNVPEPKIPRKTNKNGVETILDLAVKQFLLQNGSIEVHAEGKPPKITPWNAAGENLRSHITYDAAGPSYRGDISMQPLRLKWNGYEQIPVNVSTSLVLDKNRLQVSNAKLETPESRIELSGRVENFTTPVATLQYDARLSVAEAGRVLHLRSRQSGTVQLGGNARYASATDYSVTGNLHATNLEIRQGTTHLRNVRADSSLYVDPKKIALTGMRIAALGGQILGRAEVLDMQKVRAEGKLEHFDVREMVALVSPQKTPWDGVISGPFDFNASLREGSLQNRSIVASTRLTISPAGSGAPVRGLIDAKYNGQSDTVDLGNSFVALPATRLDFAGVLGKQLTVHLQSTDLNDLLPALQTASASAPKTLPVALQNGAVVFDGAVTGSLSAPRIQGHLAAQNFVYSNQKVDSLTADIALQNSGAQVSNGLLTYQAERAQFAGAVGLKDWKAEDNQPVTANIAVQNAQIPDLLALAGQKNIPVQGTLNAAAQVSGTVGDPHATMNLNVGKGSIYDEPFDRLTAKADYVNGGMQVLTAQMNAGPKQIDLKASFQHAPTDFLAGKIAFDVKSNQMALAQFQTIKKYQPGISGNVQVNLEGSANLTRFKPAADKPEETRFELGSLNGDITAAGLQVEGRALGDTHLTAKTQGTILTAHLDSDVAHSVIRGDGQWQLTGDYPGDAQITFSKVDLAALRALAIPAKTGDNLNFGGSVEGKLTVSGPALKPESLKSTLEIPQLEIHPLPAPGMNAQVASLSLKNEGPVRVAMANNVIRVESAHFVGRETDITLVGQVALSQKNPLELHVHGTLDLALLKSFSQDLDSSGSVVANANIRGSFAQPQIAGRMDLKDANFSIVDLPNGLTHANGTVLFDGSRATVEKLTAESGGGKVNLAGFVALAGTTLAFRVEATANEVRVRYPEGASTVADASLTLTGTNDRSVLSGTVTILRTGFNPRTDLGSVLSTAGAPAKTPTAQTGILGGMQFDVQIDTSPDISFQTSVAEGLQAEASLRLRGSGSNPVLLGRINITQGEMTFFGNKYVINQGTISFFNPVKLEPILNIDLDTHARGVDVTITVSGPIDKLNVSYRSDPPLQFSDIVALLATGRAPNDPTIAARQTGTPQTWQQMGASAIVGQAIANPVAGRLQRFFGVSKLKIDPLLTGVTGNPQARLTVEQQVTPDLTFTYITDVASTSTQIIRVELAFNRHWSAVLLREENGYVGLDFLYKKRFN
jgi:translocation and assembly module TamB